jgi:hypothetical protein
MFSATCNPQHFAGDNFIAIYEKGAVRKKEYGPVLTSVIETRQSRLETSSCGTQSWWNGETEICSAFLAY